MDLVEQAIAGQPLALDRLLIDSYGRLLARVEQKLPAELRGVIGPEDIIQDTFAMAFKGIGNFRPEGSDAFFRWLAAIAENRVIDAVRARNAVKRGGGGPATGQQRSSLAALVDLVAVNAWTPSRSVGGREAAAAVQVALAGLKTEYRDALTARYLEGRSVAEAAARLGKSEQAMHKLCSRGLQALKEALGESARYLSRSG
jgi:RNA polymerase sigma-70 factor (ECF subfamily)